MLSLRFGEPAWRESYTPFGEALTKPAANDNRRGFTGHVGDSASSLIYMQARYFDPAVGRFLSTDPIGYQDQLNLYAYVHNDPVGGVDPDGTQTVPGSMDPQTTLRVMEVYAAAGHAVVQEVREDPGIVLDAAAIVIDVIDIPSGESAAMIAARRAARAARVAEDARPSTLTPGPNARESIPAQPGRPTARQQRQINEIGDRNGCHTCGTRESGRENGNWTGDHQPPSALNTEGNPQQYHPHCATCSSRQGAQVRQERRQRGSRRNNQ